MESDGGGETPPLGGAPAESGTHVVSSRTPARIHRAWPGPFDADEYFAGVNGTRVTAAGAVALPAK